MEVMSETQGLTLSPVGSCILQIKVHSCLPMSLPIGTGYWEEASVGCVESTFLAVELGPAVPMGGSSFRVSAAALGPIWPWSEPKVAHLTLCLGF